MSSENKWQAAGLVALLIILGFMALFMTGCHQGVSLEYAKGWHDAEKGIYRAVSPKLVTYVWSDTTMATAAKEDLLGLIEDWRLRMVGDSLVIAAGEASGE